MNKIITENGYQYEISNETAKVGDYTLSANGKVFKYDCQLVFWMDGCYRIISSNDPELANVLPFIENVQVGSKKITIPEQTFETCYGCCYYKHYMVKSGFNPIYANSCQHKESPLSSFDMGNLKENERGLVVTPNWCPFKGK